MENLLRQIQSARARSGMQELNASTRNFQIKKYADGSITEENDFVVSEEPLELRLDGHPIAVLMRTPGNDEDLVRGFLITEGILQSVSQIRKIEADGNRLLVFLAEGVRVDLGKLTRNMYAGSSCGICGKATLEAIFTEFPPLEKSRMPEPEVLLAAPGKMRKFQENFSRTGGLHAAALFNFDGDLLFLREDIGRHNAVDKLIGSALFNEIPLVDCWILVSGRVSFEIMQKGLAARVPCIAAISAPSSLAIDFAKNSRQSLIGFLRPPGFNCYA